MMFMNEWDVKNSVDRYANHPVLSKATKTLAAFVDMVNENSDGWPYWSAAPRSAKRLMQLIQSGDGTEQELKKALVPMKSLCTRKKLPFPSN